MKIETDEELNFRMQQCILKRIEQFDITFSRFRKDSLVYRIATSPEGGCFNFSDDSVALFELYDLLHTVNSGAADPLVGHELELLGYDHKCSLTPVSDFYRAKVYARGRSTWSKDRTLFRTVHHS
jgi:thiamine biosynthesis lipoprotein